MNQISKDYYKEVLGVEEYLEKRKKIKKDEIKKEQEKFPDSFLNYSSFLLLTL